MQFNLRLILITQHLRKENLQSAYVVIIGTKNEYVVVIFTTKKHIRCDFCGKGDNFNFCLKLVLGVILTFSHFTHIAVKCAKIKPLPRLLIL